MQFSEKINAIKNYEYIDEDDEDSFLKQQRIISKLPPQLRMKFRPL
jgi:hypothetical protein